MDIKSDNLQEKKINDAPIYRDNIELMEFKIIYSSVSFHLIYRYVVFQQQMLPSCEVFVFLEYLENQFDLQ